MNCLIKMMESIEIALVDENDVSFKHPKFPSGCLPEIHPAASSTMANLQGKWLVARSGILSATNAQMTTEERGLLDRPMIQDAQMRGQ
jgi:hypothetical protein